MAELLSNSPLDTADNEGPLGPQTTRHPHMQSARAESCIMPPVPPLLYARTSGGGRASNSSTPGNRLRSSFLAEIEGLKKPTLGRFAVSWSHNHSSYHDPPGLVRLPTTRELYPEGVKESKEARELCVPGTPGHIFVLSCACFVVVGSVAAKVVLMAVSVELMADMGMSLQMYGVVGGLPSLSSIFACPFGGGVVDAIGSDRGCLLFAAVVLLGSACGAVGISIRSLPLLIAGQLVLGLGEKPLGSGQLVFIRLAADPAKLAFYFSVASSVYRTASFGSFVLAPLVAAASPMGYRASVYMATGLCFLSLLSSLPMLGKLRHLDAFLRPAVVVGEELGEEMYLMEGGKEGGEEIKGKRKEKGWKYKEEEGEEEEEDMVVDEGAERGVVEVEEEVEVGKEEVVERKWEGWKNYLRGLSDPGFLLLLVAISAMYVALTGLQTFSVDFLQKDLGLSARRASFSASIFDVAGIFLGPPLGKWVDRELGKGGRAGRRTGSWLWPPGSTQAWGIALTAVGLLLPIMALQSWLVGFILISLGFAMATAAMWPIMPLFVPLESLGLALGITTSMLEAGILGTNILIGQLVGDGDGYQKAGLPLLLALVVLALGTTLLMIPRLKGVLKAEGSPEEGGK